MMKKLCLLTLLFLAALPLAALRCGDKAAELPRLKYLHGVPRKAAGAAAEGTLRILTLTFPFPTHQYPNPVSVMVPGSAVPLRDH